MPVFRGNNFLKLFVLTEDQKRGITIEYPIDMKTGELLDKVTELKDQLVKAKEEEIKKEKEIADKKDDKAEDIKEVKGEIVTEKKPEAV